MEQITRNDQVNKYLQELRQKGYSPGTVRYREIYLKQFFSFLGKKQLNKKNIQNYQTHLVKSKKLKPLTVHGKLSVLHCFLKWLASNNVMLAGLASVIIFPKKEYSLSKSILNAAEIKYFLSLPNVKTQKGIRDKAILELLYSSAMRRAELAGLNLYDLNIEAQTVRVLGKGKKERTLPVGSDALFWLLKYIQEIRNGKNPALFLDCNCHKRLAPQTINNLVHEYAKQSKLKKKITPHTFRHTCAVHLLKGGHAGSRAGADIRYIQQLLGHKSVATTQIYTQIVIADLEAVYRNTHPRAKRN
jgi:integrase/recombinase XerD